MYCARSSLSHIHDAGDQCKQVPGDQDRKQNIDAQQQTPSAFGAWDMREWIEALVMTQ